LDKVRNKPDNTQFYLRTLGAGWTIFILKCADGSYRGGMTRNLKRVVADINHGINGKSLGHHFGGHPERLPVKVVYEEKKVRFKEAYAKCLYLYQMNRVWKERLIKTRVWPIGGPLREWIIKTPVEEFYKNKNL
jgi:predicted GIY-YIG superfamily endonuclease